MARFLTIKHWQLFVLTWGLGILTIPLPIEYKQSGFIYLLALPAGLGMYGWIYAIGTELQKRLPQSLRSSQTLFRFHSAYIFFCNILIGVMMMFKEVLNVNQSMGSIFFLLLLYMFVAVFSVTRFAAKSFASVEMKINATISDYAGYLMLIWFFPFGIWIIQPKLNRIIEQNLTAA